jgi:hypothetical protein
LGGKRIAMTTSREGALAAQVAGLEELIRSLGAEPEFEPVSGADSEVTVEEVLLFRRVLELNEQLAELASDSTKSYDDYEEQTTLNDLIGIDAYEQAKRSCRISLFHDRELLRMHDEIDRGTASDWVKSYCGIDKPSYELRKFVLGVRTMVSPPDLNLKDIIENWEKYPAPVQTAFTNLVTDRAVNKEFAGIDTAAMIF